ncbi:DNA-directed RNA polymerase I subunit RPA34.5-domain-containing protein [Aspergillus californicus]
MAPKSDKATKPAHKTRSESESSSSAESNRKVEESSSSGSESDTSASDGNNESAPATKDNKAQDGQPAHKSQARSFRPPQPYKPPHGFKSAKPKSTSSSTSSLSNLNGKQVFHITAPAFLPLSKVKEVSLAQAMKGQPILEHKGVQFGIPVDSLKQAGASAQTLSLYDPKTQTYQDTTTNIPTYHIQEMISIPGGAEYEEAAVKAANALVKPPRKQPKHLKMRFRPVGSGDSPPEILGSSGEQSEDEEPTIKAAKGLEKEKKKKRKHQQTEGDASQAPGLPRKKSKKHSDEAVHAVEEPKKSKARDSKKRKKAEKA